MSAIFLIRHGKTQANELHLYCGSTDLPLSPGGEAELKQLRYRLPPSRFLTSGMVRTEQTLALLFGDIPHSQAPEFREIDFGCFEMQSYAQLKDDPDYLSWISGDNHRNVPPGGESGEQMEQRVLSAFRRLEAENIPTVLITHGGVIACIMAYLFPSENKNRYQWQPEPGHGYAVYEGRYETIP
ncbi:MAG: histidine phosphatase family protein [Faecousia sp.]